tara:strand:+ start:264 stop:1139 length:876 start_codon:yes stop_codon:yes gene_type:complete
MGNLVTSLLYQPPTPTYVSTNPHLVWLETSGEAKIPAFYINRGASVTMLFSHGNAEDIGMLYDWFVTFTQNLGVNVMCYDYEGYGRSEGSKVHNPENVPNEQSCYEDIDAAWNYLTNTLGKDPSSIVIYGRSLGSGPSCYLAERLSQEKVKVAALVLQSPISSVFRVAFDFRFTMPGDMFCNVDRMPNMRMRVLVIHGTKDEIVPFGNGEQLFLACPAKYRAVPYWCENAGHNDVESFTANNVEFFDKLSAFLKQHVESYHDFEGGASPEAVAEDEEEGWLGSLWSLVGAQ